MFSNKVILFIVVLIVLVVAIAGASSEEYGLYGIYKMDSDTADSCVIPNCEENETIIYQSEGWSCVNVSNACQAGETVIGGGYCTPTVDGEHCGDPSTGDSTWVVWGVGTKAEAASCVEGTMQDIVTNEHNEKVGFLCTGAGSLQTSDTDVIGGGYCSEDETPASGCGPPGTAESSWITWGKTKIEDEDITCEEGAMQDIVTNENDAKLGFLCRE